MMPVAVETLDPELRLRLKAAFDTMADLLEEETALVPRAEAEQMALYRDAKQQLFEQLGILLREAHRAPPLPALPPVEAAADTPPDSGEETEPDPADPALVRQSAARLRQAVEANTRTLQAAQEAVTSLTRHLARAADKARTDGVYGRAGLATPRGTPGFARVEHEL